MEEITRIAANVSTLLVVVGGGVAVVMFMYVGWLFMFAGGEPQRLARARLAGIVVVGGLILLGVSAVMPRVVVDVLVSPLGGDSHLLQTAIEVADTSAADCDALFQYQLSRMPQPAFTTQVRLLAEATRGVDYCKEGRWQARIWDDYMCESCAPGSPWVAKAFDSCFYESPVGKWPDGSSLFYFSAGNDNGPILPLDLMQGAAGARTPAYGSRISRDGNMLIYFNGENRYENGSFEPGLPVSGSACWLFRQNVGSWTFSASMPQRTTP